MLVMHCKPDRLLPVQFARLLGNQPVPILSGSTLGLTSIRMASTMQSEPNEVVMLVLATCFEHTICGGLDAGIDKVGAIG